MTSRGALLALALLIAPPAQAQDFSVCLSRLQQAARQQGFAQAFAASAPLLQPDTSLLRLMEGQPEFSKQIWDYLGSHVTAGVIAQGQSKLTANATLFDRIEKQYGVDRGVVAAIWGMETGYGANKGNKNILRSTATLACMGRRQEFFAEQFLGALEVVQRGDEQPDEFKGSWAGAFGHTQFMPSTYHKYAVDFDGDGRRDLIGSAADALASTARYLQAEGWKPGLSWGYEVDLPQGFRYTHVGREAPLSPAQWQGLGVTRTGGRPLPRNAESLWLFLPAGQRGPALLMTRNFDALRAYNTSESYGLAVGVLADRLRGGGGIQHPWPRDEKPLSLSDRILVQTVLQRAGYDIGTPDGRFGSKTREAVRQWQKRAGLVPDGFVGAALLARMKGAAR